MDDAEDNSEDEFPFKLLSFENVRSAESSMEIGFQEAYNNAPSQYNQISETKAPPFWLNPRVSPQDSTPLPVSTIQITLPGGNDDLEARICSYSPAELLIILHSGLRVYEELKNNAVGAYVKEEVSNILGVQSQQVLKQIESGPLHTMRGLGEDLRQEMVMLRRSVNSFGNDVRTSAIKGAIGEALATTEIQRHFPMAEIKDVSKHKMNTDIEVTLEFAKVLIEVKTLKNNVATSDVKKFRDTLLERPGISAGILLSHTSGIAKKSILDYTLETLGNGHKQLHLFLPNSMDCDLALIFALHFCDWFAKQQSEQPPPQTDMAVENLTKSLQDLRDKVNEIYQFAQPLESSLKAMKAALKGHSNQIDRLVQFVASVCGVKKHPFTPNRKRSRSMIDATQPNSPYSTLDDDLLAPSSKRPRRISSTPNWPSPHSGKSPTRNSIVDYFPPNDRRSTSNSVDNQSYSLSSNQSQMNTTAVISLDEEDEPINNHGHCEPGHLTTQLQHQTPETEQRLE